MTRNELIAKIRTGIIAGAYDIPYVLEYLRMRDYHTVGDVPEHEHESMIKHLDARASE